MAMEWKTLPRQLILIMTEHLTTWIRTAIMTACWIPSKPASAETTAMTTVLMIPLMWMHSLRVLIQTVMASKTALPQLIATTMVSPIIRILIPIMMV